MTVQYHIVTLDKQQIDMINAPATFTLSRDILTSKATYTLEDDRYFSAIYLKLTKRDASLVELVLVTSNLITGAINHYTINDLPGAAKLVWTGRVKKSS